MDDQWIVYRIINMNIQIKGDEPNPEYYMGNIVPQKYSYFSPKLDKAFVFGKYEEAVQLVINENTHSVSYRYFVDLHPRCRYAE